MNKENKKMAQERRAAERKKKEAMRVVKNVVIAAVIVVAFVGIIVYGAIDSKKAKEQEAAGADANETSQTTEQDTQTEEQPELSTDPERKVKSGDTVAIHYEGSVDGIAFQGGTGDYDLTIGSHSFIDDFEDQLIGHNIGETVEVNVTFPEGYGGTYQDADGAEQSLSGKDAVFIVDIKGIYSM